MLTGSILNIRTSNSTESMAVLTVLRMVKEAFVTESRNSGTWLLSELI